MVTETLESNQFKNIINTFQKICTCNNEDLKIFKKTSSVVSDQSSTVSYEDNGADLKTYVDIDADKKADKEVSNAIDDLFKL